VIEIVKQELTDIIYSESVLFHFAFHPMEFTAGIAVNAYGMFFTASYVNQEARKNSGIGG
jgi:hypothetical protein